jgi:hypothetical protein
MSTLQVANIHLETTANNRIQYNGSNTLILITGGANNLIANSTSTTISVGGANNLVANSTTTQLQVNSANVVVANSTSTIIAVGGTTELTVNSTAAVFAGTVADATATLRPFVNATAVALTTQSTVDFNDIPSWVKKISVVFFAVSLSGTDRPLIQLGTGTSGSPSFTASGYQSYTSEGGATSTAGFIIGGASAGDARYGTLYIINQDGNKWVASGILNSSTSTAYSHIGQVTLGSALTQLRLTRTGTNTFDAGNINILYE